MSRSSRRARRKNYLAYLIRLERVDEGSAWRVSLESISGDEICRFKDLESAVHFLQEQIALSEMDNAELDDEK